MTDLRETAARLAAAVAARKAEGPSPDGRPSPRHRKRTMKTVVRDERGRIKEVLERTEWVPPTS